MKTKETYIVELGMIPEDMQKFIEKCYADGTTPGEVLEGFINDIVDGTYSRGSDERMYAGQYYDRCGYPYQGTCNFTQYLIETGWIKHTAGVLDDERHLHELWEAYCKENEYHEEKADALDYLQNYFERMQDYYLKGSDEEE